MRKIVGLAQAEVNMPMRSHDSSFPNVWGPSVFQNGRSHFTFWALDIKWSLLYHTMLKFRPYHKLWRFNENILMTFHFLMHSTSRFQLLFSFVRSIFAKVDRKKSLVNYMRKLIGFVLRFWILYKKRVVKNGPSQRHRPVYVPPFLPLPGAFRDLDEVCAEVPEDSRVLRVRRLWFPTSDHYEIWRILSGTTRSRQYHESTMVWRYVLSYLSFQYFVLSFFMKRAWPSVVGH